MERDQLEQMVRMRIPLLTRNTKGKIENPFVSNHAREEVIQSLVYGLWEEMERLKSLKSEKVSCDCENDEIWCNLHQCFKDKVIGSQIPNIK